MSNAEQLQPYDSASRKRRPRTPPGIAFLTVERLIARLHGIDAEDPIALRARLHTLRKLNFPDGVAAGSGHHFAYAAADVIGIALAFELIEAFVPPAVAVAIVRAGWPELARNASHGWRLESPSAVATVHPRALRNARGSEDALPPHHVEIAALTGPRDSRRTIAIDVGDLARRIAGETKRMDAREQALMSAGMEEMARRFGNGPPLDRAAAKPGTLGGDGRFWERASSLLAATGETIDAGDVRALTWYLDYIARPAPIDQWKKRVEVEERLEDVGFAVALAWICAQAGLRPARTALPADDLERVGTRLLATLGSTEQVRERLAEIVATALRRNEA